MKIQNIWSFSKLVNHSNLGNYLIFQILKFWGWGLEFQRSKTRIGEVTNSAEYQIDEQNQNLPIFGITLWFSKLERKLPNFKISKIINIPLLTNSNKNNQSSEIVEFKKLAIFLNLTICKTIKIQKISNFMVNYQICILSVRII